MTEKQGSNSMMLPLLAGLAGAGLALLFAPRSGKETRDKINSQANEFNERANNKINHTKEQVHHGMEKIGDSTAKFKSAINHKLHKADKELDEKLEQQQPSTEYDHRNWDREV